MKIKKLEMTNFKGTDSLTLDLPEVVSIFYGNNGAGKSSVIEAFKYILTGKCPYNVIKNGTAYTMVRAVLENDDIVQIVKQANGSATKYKYNGSATTGKSILEEIQKQTGVELETANAITLTELLLNMKPKDFAQLILKYITEELEYADVESYMPKTYEAKNPHNEEKTEYTNTEIDAAKKIGEKLFPKGKFGTAKIAEISGFCREQSLALRNDIKFRQKTVDSLPNVKPSRSQKEVEDDLAEIYKAEGAQENYKKALIAYQNAEATKLQQEKLVADIQTQVDAITCTKPNDTKLKEVKEQIEAAKNSKIRFAKIEMSLESSIKSSKKILDNLDAPVCPISCKLTCTTDKSGIKNDLLEEIKNFEESLESMKEEIQKVDKEIAKLESELKALRDEEMLYQKKITLINNLNAAKKAIRPLPQKPTIQNVVDFKTEKADLEKELALCKNYTKRIEEINAIDTLVQKYHMYNYLYVALCDKGEVLQNVMNYYVGILSKVCNDRIALVAKDYEFKFTFDDGLILEFKPGANKDFVVFESLSEGEKAYASFFVLDMLNQLSKTFVTDENGNTVSIGFNTLFLDGLEKLDGKTIDALFEIIQNQNILDDYDNIIVNMVAYKELITKAKKLKANIFAL